MNGHRTVTRCVARRPPLSFPRLPPMHSGSRFPRSLVSRSGAAMGALAALFAAPLSAQNTNNAGLQGDPSMLTPGGWIWPAADAGNPQNNPPTPYDDDRIQLGKALFWDEQVSSSSTMACATCHIPQFGGIDPRPGGNRLNTFGQQVIGSFGVVPQEQPGGPGGTIDYGFIAPPSVQETRGITPIHVPTMIGAYMFNNLLWDMSQGPVFNWTGGPVLFPNWSAMENQAAGPPGNDIEMGHQGLIWGTGDLESKLNKAAPLALATSIPGSIPAAWLTMQYAQVFDNVFAASAIPGIAAPQGVTRERFAMAIAAYERTLVPDQAPIDTNTMTLQEEMGFDIFVMSGCVRCHSVTGNPTLRYVGGPSGVLNDPWDNPFSDGQGHDIMIPNHPGRSIGRVKTPTLRNVGLKTRFFHDGQGRVIAGTPFNTLPDIVDFYDLDQPPGLELIGFGGPNLTAAERAAVIAFLGNALTDPRVAAGTAPFDGPTLFTQTQPFNSNHTNPATAAPAGWQPLMIGDVPPLVEKVGGPSWWKVGVGSNGAGTGSPVIPAGAKAILYMDVSNAGGGPLWLPSPTFLASQAITAQGFATAHVPMPLSTSMIGMTFFLQWRVHAGPGQDGWSECASFTVF
jgi:cytochrome c peroxidase